MVQDQWARFSRPATNWLLLLMRCIRSPVPFHHGNVREVQVSGLSIPCLMIYFVDVFGQPMLKNVSAEQEV